MFIVSWLVATMLVIAWVIFSILSYRGLRRAQSLESIEYTEPFCPLVSVVIAAKNESHAIEATIDSLLAQSWPNLEIIVVDDRSTDDTLPKLRKIEQDNHQVKVLAIDRLETGWLGKNNALQQGARLACGDWILFTDADVTFSTEAISTAMQFSLQQKIDHLALSPHLIAKGFWLKMTIYFFLYNVMIIFRPQNASWPHSKAYVGIGAFNLMKKSVYHSVGEHQQIALRSDDDLALGEKIKKAGYHQVFAGGSSLIAVTWYPSLPAMARGLEKNVMAPFHYRFYRFLGAIFAITIFYEGPILGMLWGHGESRVLFLLAFLIEWRLFALTRTYSGVSGFWGLSIPFSLPITVFIFLRSALLCAWRGGIVWRGTFYPLQELRQQSTKYK